MLNPEEDFSSDRALTKEDVHRLIDVRWSAREMRCVVLVLSAHPSSPLPPFLDQSPQGSTSTELRQLRGHANNKIVLVRVLNTDKDKVRTCTEVATV